MSSSIDQLTLREKVREAERVLRELVEHLEMGFIPKVHELKKLSRQHDPASGSPPVADVTIRSYVSAVVESDRFTGGLVESFDNYLNAIQKDVSEVVNRGIIG